MARELGMNPKKLGRLDNHRQEPWKLPLPLFIEHLYFKRFGKRRPDNVVSIEERARQEEHRKALKRDAKQRRAETGQRSGPAGREPLFSRADAEDA